MNRNFILEQFKGGHIYSFIGAGGKTSTIKEAARVLSAEGYKVVISTTTKFSIEEFQGYKITKRKHLTIIELEDLESGINVFISGELGEKYIGYSKNDIEKLLHIPLNVVILLEADGSRRLPFKVPMENEPVVPENSIKTFLVLSAKIVDDIISENNTYNLSKVQEILNEGTMIYSTENILKLLEQGWLLDTYYRNLKIIFNQGDTLTNNYVIKDLLENIYNKYGIGVYLISIHEKEVYLAFDDKVGALILAAGAGKRMSDIKQLMKIGNTNFLEETIRKYSGFAQEIIVTLGYHKEEIRRNIKEIGFKYQNIDGYEEGMGASFREVEKFHADYFMVTPCDLPLVEENTIEILLGIYRKNRGKIIVPRFKGRNGHPVIFPIGIQESFKNIKGDKGARDLIKGLNCFYVEVDDPGVIADIDTNDDYLKIKEAFNGEGFN